MSLLEIKNLKKSFGKTEVLKGVNFSLEKGEVLSILGSSGGGKTTLLRCMNFLEFAEEGQIIVDGNVLYDGNSIDEKQIRENRLNFGLVFQNFNLFPQHNVLDNLCLAPKLRAQSEPDFKKRKKELYDEIEKKAMETLEHVGLLEKAKNYPCELSGGQQQRVAIARALMLSPKILCFDEPTSALDPELTGEVLKVIRELKSSDRTMIVVTHEMGFAKSVSDKVIYMADGVIEEMGTPEQVFDNPQSPKTKAFLQRPEL
ncbi:MAG: amino acid ABC transporter ATP-binding protein [Clostridia bacterium]|nr:amino acid ABC transporter ATP-binding protein [Clostridia bacterium]